MTTSLRGGGLGCTRGLDLSYTRSFRVLLYSDFYIGTEHYIVRPRVLFYCNVELILFVCVY